MPDPEDDNKPAHPRELEKPREAEDAIEAGEDT